MGLTWKYICTVRGLTQQLPQTQLLMSTCQSPPLTRLWLSLHSMSKRLCAGLGWVRDMRTKMKCLSWYTTPVISPPLALWTIPRFGIAVERCGACFNFETCKDLFSKKWSWILVIPSADSEACHLQVWPKDIASPTLFWLVPPHYWYTDILFWACWTYFSPFTFLCVPPLFSSFHFLAEKIQSLQPKDQERHLCLLVDSISSPEKGPPTQKHIHLLHYASAICASSHVANILVRLGGLIAAARQVRESQQLELWVH